MRSHRLLTIGAAALVAGALAGWIALERLPDVFGTRSAEVTEVPVLIVVVGSRPQVERVRRVAAPDQTLRASADGFALRRGLIVVSAVEHAGPLLSEVGWGDRPLEILDVDRARAARGMAPASGEGSGPGADEVGTHLQELIRQPNLTLGEARELLGSM